MQMQNEQKGVLTRNYHNYSNIKFNDTEPLKPSSQSNFRSVSQVGRMMTDQIQQPNHSRTIYHYNNKIVQTAKDYEFPATIDPQFQKNNTKYEQFFQKSKKFIKPYTECTKYSDSLMKNRQLLRRGQFDLPTEPISVPNLPVKTTPSCSFSQMGTKTFTSQLYKNRTLLQRNCQTMDNIRKRKPSSDQKNGFDKTMKQYIVNYNNLMNQDRKNRNDEIRFKNSMNRILAAQMINYKMMGNTSTSGKPQSVRLEREKRNL